MESAGRSKIQTGGPRLAGQQCHWLVSQKEEKSRNGPERQFTRGLMCASKRFHGKRGRSRFA
jgi:hypothetical protein